MAKNTSVTLGDHFEGIIDNGIKSGRYASVSEVIRAGLRLLEEEEKKIEALRMALEEGENSGFVTDFDPDVFLRELHERHALE